MPITFSFRGHFLSEPFHSLRD